MKVTEFDAVSELEKTLKRELCEPGRYGGLYEDTLFADETIYAFQRANPATEWDFYCYKLVEHNVKDEQWMWVDALENLYDMTEKTYKTRKEALEDIESSFYFRAYNTYYTRNCLEALEDVIKHIRERGM